MTARTGRSATGGDVAQTKPAQRLRTADRPRTSGSPEATDRPQVIDRPQVSDRITVALIPKVSEDLQHLQDRTNLSKTDIANRAITLYEFIEAQLRAGKDILIRDRETSETQSVVLL
jgi:hypothetical protein